MKIADQGIILSVRKYSENSLIVKILSENYGIYSGFVKSGIGKKTYLNYQIGNLVNFTWQARTDEQLGLLRIEVSKSFLAEILSDPIKLNSLSTIIAIIEKNILEKEPHEELFQKMLNFLNNLPSKNDVFLANYITLEIELLQILGYGIDLSACAVTGSRENLCFVSPKSGRAVSKEAGAKYQDRLLKLPRFLLENFETKEAIIEKEDLLAGLTLSSFFIEKYIYQNSKNLMPLSRNRLIGLVKAENFTLN